MVKYAPYHVLITREPVTHTTKSGREIVSYKTSRSVKMQVFQSLDLALREHAEACKEGRGVLLHIEPPLEDALSWDELTGEIEP